MFLKTQEEMEKINVSQIGQSACGPTSVLNILAALDFTPLPSPEKLLQFFPARLKNRKYIKIFIFYSCSWNYS